MKTTFEKRLSALADAKSSADGKTVAGGKKGIEKESLRVGLDGRLSTRPHPLALGSALTNPFITTDFSEALLEFVTPAFTTTWETLRCICDIHQFTYERLDDEQLWVASMPCGIPADGYIPLARYGTSNVGQMKTIYRRGLGHRYGRHMQLIAGVHFNYSMPEYFWPHYQQILGDTSEASAFRSAHYMAMVRNFRRAGWLLLYLFGASPALCKSFARGEETGMKSLNPETLYEPFGTSLRMSDLGYNNQNQARININLNSIDDYIADLAAATRTPEQSYEKIGVKVDGKYQQLNANLLQIENEYYSSVRPKRVAMSGERPTAALRRGGIEYVEIRSLDINVFDPCGVNQNTMRFIEAFLVYCLLEPSQTFDDTMLAEAAHNQLQTAKYGRDPGLNLIRDGSPILLTDWARRILAKVADVAELIDSQESGDSYASATRAMLDLVNEPDATPSARVLEELCAANCSFFDFVLTAAESHRNYFKSIAALSDERHRELSEAATQSLQRQRDLEASDTLTLDEYLERYFESE